MSGSGDFSGLRVAIFEDRRAAQMQQLVEQFGGAPCVAPSLRAAPPVKNPLAIDFANRLITGQIEVVILSTGASLAQLVAQVERHVERKRFLDALADVTTVARGFRSLPALRRLGLAPSLQTPAPGTWRDVLMTLDAWQSIAGLSVGVVEQERASSSLIAGLEARGAQVTSLVVHPWALPEDTGPLEEAARALAGGQIDVVLFTSSVQVNHLLQIASRLGLSEPVRQGLRQAVVASYGRSVRRALATCGVTIDVEPSQRKRSSLVEAAARAARTIRARKRRPVSIQSRSERAASERPASVWDDSLFMRACRRQEVERTPVWLMRQAGRYMPEYRRIREGVPFLELCKNPQLCSEIMCTAVAQLGVDAAILFSDLLPILEPMGLALEFAPGDGPVIHNPVRTAADVDRVAELESIEAVGFVVEAARQTRADLPQHIPLIGFAGAPFTLASYAIEGGGSRSYLHTKTLMYRDEGAWAALMERLARGIVRYLSAQVAAGAQAVQLFDSWVGCLGPSDYRRYVLPYVRQVVEGLPAGVPVIHFGTGNPALLPLQAEAGGSVIGVDWRINLDDAWRDIGYDRAIQGNLDPLALLAGEEEIRRQVARVLDQAGGRPGHIFNLGHGVIPQTPVASARALVEAVHELSARRR